MGRFMDRRFWRHSIIITSKWLNNKQQRNNATNNHTHI